jgi:hypothetical protein
MSKRYRSKTCLPTELTWEEKNQPNYLYQPSVSFEKMKNINMNWFYSAPGTRKSKKQQ